ncbi:ribosome small subunit-dependent GTPase A [Candidatus Desulforudis audaxviator]|uniref:Small ribosomal subunit biogenesis GTPase RsgA n=1 Tax=Desulforudis audaxviator (strain MP104C) TaxID=477974 RepID=B1I4Z8_DESAP|nr:ribosome small subunit-dependent GTPase A [Candidatus Desulforudis audaxviator]ACA60089.1 ribosome small subunit-dependent GTPase A [Candidatus Desulforudis audaxviator MP104C]AZK60125.1 Ribosome small subunit-stimulated GTPase EngC [Candidatus Desulforudis audaxviator]
MPEGLVIKAYGGFCFVWMEGKVEKCTLRGKLRTRGRVLAGDEVVVRSLSGGRGVVEEVKPRRSEMVRPPVANADQALVVVSFREPSPALNLLDRILVHCEAAGIRIVICVNKLDLAAPGAENEAWIETYRDAGYPTLVTSAVTGEGVAALREALARRITVVAGPSGSGKSSLINAVQPGLNLRTGEISPKLQRGRHVTRHVELLALEGGGWVADAPGFSVLRLEGIDRAELAGLFPEFGRHTDGCRFADCVHYREPDCAVRRAVAGGAVARFRYAHYLGFLREILAREGKNKL